MRGFLAARVGLEAAKFGIMVGDAMDLTTGWDFNKEEECKRAEEYMDEHEPLVRIGSLPVWRSANSSRSVQRARTRP